MAWKNVLGTFLKSTPMISMYGGILTTTVYVAYKDYSRIQCMLNVYRTGNILPPFTENDFETEFQSRPAVESQLVAVLNNKFSNEYYIINGEVGVGKTRSILEVVRHLMNSSGKQNLGAPIFVTVDQGKSFPDTLAAAIHFNFDEHINFRTFLDIVLRIESIPKKDEASKLIRVLEALEESAFVYTMKYKKPVVLIIDGIASLNRTLPGALEKIQDKAKMWADCNIIKLIFVNNDEEVEEKLQRNSSAWSRAATPFVLEDLTESQTHSFLTTNYILRKDKNSYAESKDKSIKLITPEDSEKIYELVGGRILYLVSIKRDYMKGFSLDRIFLDMKDREKEKFINVSRRPSTWKVISLLRSFPHKSMKLSKLIKATDKDDVDYLCKLNVIRLVRDDIGIMVKFNSKLTENVVEELEMLYQRELQEHKEQCTSPKKSPVS
ncbi:hypothetical protein HELRODRAFT_174791 [Helobdella robusta]|uniref:Orc1-like AAA ATPase domain-containing protein n=1 Tax=Helobdella robusta TaxID=6412 RepID=T1F8H2_HELRO|nr:hypothetical protein HELRODRAFT_174791 [Helobdella robusta]ESO01245.1 hypothetical protein HELRODRAFT_174791 [Helobdella robusta]